MERPSAEGRQQLLHFWPDSGRLETLPAAVLASDTRTVAAFPDGKEIAVVGFSGGQEGPRHLFVVNLESRQTRDLSGPLEFGIPRQHMESEHPEVIAVSADGKAVYTLRYRDDSLFLVAIPRNGANRERVIMQFTVGTAPLGFDSAPDGSLYADQSAFQTSVLRIGANGSVISEDAIPLDATGVLPLPEGFVFALERGGKSQLLVARSGTEPRPLLNGDEAARLPGALLADGKLAFVIGDGPQSRLAIASLHDGTTLQRFQSDAQDVTALAASPDTGMLYYAQYGIIWRQAISGGEPQKLGRGYDVTADPAGKWLYLMRVGDRGYELCRMPASGGDTELMELPPAYKLTPSSFSPAAVNRDGRLLLPVNSLTTYFYQEGVYDPLRRSISMVRAPPETVVSNGGWSSDGSTFVKVTRWSSRLWRYRPPKE